jgi:CRP/FNR family transcriptional regulator
LLRVMAGRLRRTSERLSELVFFDLPSRMARRLRELACEHGRETPGGTAIGVSLTTDEVAPLVGATAEQTERELQALQEAGIVHWDGSTVTVRSPELLADRARGGLRYVPIGHVTVPRWLLDA